MSAKVMCRITEVAFGHFFSYLKELRLLKEASENESSTSVSALCDTQILRLTQLLEG